MVQYVEEEVDDTIKMIVQTITLKTEEPAILNKWIRTWSLRSWSVTDGEKQDSVLTYVDIHLHNRVCAFIVEELPLHLWFASSYQRGSSWSCWCCCGATEINQNWDPVFFIAFAFDERIKLCRDKTVLEKSSKLNLITVYKEKGRIFLTFRRKQCWLLFVGISLPREIWTAKQQTVTQTPVRTRPETYSVNQGCILSREHKVIFLQG